MAFGGGSGYDAGNPAGFINALVSEGVAPSEGLDIFRQAGGQIRDSRWFDLYGQIATSNYNEPGVQAYNPLQIPNADLYGEWAAGSGGKFATSVDITMLDRENGFYFTQKATYMSDQAHTPEEAQSAILSQFSDPEDMSNYGVTTMGAIATAFWQTVPFNG